MIGPSHFKRSHLPIAAGVVGVCLLSGCPGPQSALDPAGRDAHTIAQLFYWMAGSAVVIWMIVLGLAVFAVHHHPENPDWKKIRLFIIGGGTLFPTIVLTVLLVYGLGLMPRLLEPGREDDVKIEIVGEQWWWRVRYELPDGRRFETANEVRLPVGERTTLKVRAADVIHSFWVPALGGKMDMIPGRINQIALEPTREGRFRGVCAEYCGLSHAKMAFFAVVTERAAYDGWLAAQLRPARPPEGEVAQRGRELFGALGCGSCHTVRGTPANGVLGPDLTHVGSRVSLGGGILPNDVESFRRWLDRLNAIKPGVHMPEFSMLPDDERTALATWLEGLQ